MKRSLHLVDASPYVFRAFHSLPSSLRDPEGRQVNAVYGFAGFLLKLFEDERPTHLAICFDASLTTSFRNRLYPAYKAHREPPPAELEAQVDDCREMARALGLATFGEAPWEADDLIASLAARNGARFARTVIVTSDKDLTQLVDSRVTLFDFARDERLGPSEVETKLGVRPRQVPDYLGLAGDSVDNIPGVRGIGAKTASALLARFDTLDAILDDLERVANLPIRGARSIAAKLERDAEMARLSKRLATVSTEAPVPKEAGELELAGYDERALDELCERLGFTRLAGRVERTLGRD